MTMIRVNKLEAARRQIDAAIRMTFACEDPIAIHSVAHAASRIIRDVCKSRGGSDSYSQLKSLIRPEREKEFWNAVNLSANFLKHADKDPDATHTMNEEATDFEIVLAARWYLDLGCTPTREMNAFANWFSVCYPNLFLFAASEPGRAALVEEMQKLSRRDRLKAGRQIFLPDAVAAARCQPHSA